MNKYELDNAMQEYVDGRPIRPPSHKNHTNELYGRIVECAERFEQELLQLYNMDVHNMTVKELTHFIIYDTAVSIPSGPARFEVSLIETIHVKFEINGDSEEQIRDDWAYLDWENIRKQYQPRYINSSDIMIKEI